MKIIRPLIVFLSHLFLLQNLMATDKPNVLFLVVEDISPYLFPAYGNTDITTPNIDFLAENGVIFRNAFANAPHCSPARSTLISGTQATVYGNDIHRQKHHQSAKYFLPSLLRKAGYFTVNAGKRDYNINTASEALESQAWDLNQPVATYNDCLRKDKPFFGQFNNYATHMSRLTTIKLDKRLPYAVDPSILQLPFHVPDIPAMRADYALHLGGAQDIDEWVGIFIEDLEDRGLLENTIIFFFSDHGGALPRGKAFPFDTGNRVPLVVYAPKKYEHLLPSGPGQSTDRLVTFEDFLPTVMSMVGIEPPAHITGKPFMGEFKEAARDYAYTFRTNSGHHYDPSRTVYDNEGFHYIKYYTPYNYHGITQTFQWQMPSQLAWDQLVIDSLATPVHEAYYLPHPVEALFNLSNDPYETNNLAGDATYQTKLTELRKANENYIRRIKDLGFLTVNKRKDINAEGIDAYTWVRQTNYPIDSLIDLAEKASLGNVTQLSLFLEKSTSDKRSFRFWAAAGINTLAKQGEISTIPPEVYQLLGDRASEVAAVAAEILVRMGDEVKGLDELISRFSNPDFRSSLETLWDRAGPLEDQLDSIANDFTNTVEGHRIIARSILAKRKIGRMTDLYEQQTIDKQYGLYLKRVNNYK
ncbi:MAG: sulfatase, partial [Bacteroidota bacterium]